MSSDSYDNKHIDTSGGTYIEGNLQTNSNDFVGGDKIAVGDISGSVAAIGAGAQVIYQNIERALTEVEVAEQAEAFARRRLAEAVTSYVQRLQSQAERAREETDYGSPYKALLEYDIDDAALFYGRATAIKALLGCLRRGPLTILHAESGAGKTSLLKAGIIPRLLADGDVPLYVRPRQIHVHQAIKQRLLPQVEQVPNLTTASLHDFMSRVTELLGGQQLVVILDQFEEVFTEQNEEARASFVEQLAPCLDDDLLPLCWVLALRGQLLSQLGTFQPHVRHPFANELLLQAFTRDEAKEIIVEPAIQRGVTYEPGLVDELVKDLIQEEQIAPPQLQLVCSSLLEGLDGQTQITRVMYEQAGKAGGILRSYLDRVLSSNVPSQQRQAARRLLEALVTSEKRRASRTRDELVADLVMRGVSETTVDMLLYQLVESRLLRVEEEANLTYELVHDYLLEEIEIDPEVQSRKAAQELLGQESKAYQRHRILLSTEKLAIIEVQGEHLTLSADELDLLLRSAQSRGHSLDLWRNYAVRNHLTEDLSRRWAELMEEQDESKADMAINLLTSLSDVEAVLCLAQLIKAHSSADQDTSLRGSSPVQRRALTALAQMECNEAEAYLRQLTPDGFCFVPSGVFQMGSDEKPDEQPPHAKWLPAFWMALYPVTMADWKAFIDAGGYAQPRYWNDADRTGTAPKASPTRWQSQHYQEDLPARNLTWYEVKAYIAWLAEASGLPVALPTEAEWEKAASWDWMDQRARRYPWGEQSDTRRCNVQESKHGSPTPVDYYTGAGESPCGALDMAGNILEWTHTHYRPYPHRVEGGPTITDDDHPRVLRGGSFTQSINEARCARRHVLRPALSLINTGCRVCLRLVPLRPGRKLETSASEPSPR